MTAALLVTVASSSWVVCWSASRSIATPVEVHGSHQVVGAVWFTAGTSAVLIFDGTMLTAVLVGYMALIATTETAAGRIPLRASWAAATVAAAVAAATEGWAATTAGVSAWLIIVCLCMCAGIGPLGGPGWFTRRRATQNKAAVMGGGDPPMLAAVAAVCAATGWRHHGWAGLWFGDVTEPVFAAVSAVSAAAVIGCTAALIGWMFGWFRADIGTPAVRLGAQMIAGGVVACLIAVN